MSETALKLFEQFCDDNLKMPFGRYKGKLVKETDWDYLYWFATLDMVDQDIKNKITEIIGDHEPYGRDYSCPGVFGYYDCWERDYVW